MFWNMRKEEEVFKTGPKILPEIKKAIEKTDERKIDDIENRLDDLVQKVSLLSRYLSSLSGEIPKKEVKPEKQVDDLENRIKILKARIERLQDFKE